MRYSLIIHLVLVCITPMGIVGAEFGDELVAISGARGEWRLHESGFVCVDHVSGSEVFASTATPVGWTTKTGDEQVFESSLWNKVVSGDGPPITWMDTLLDWEMAEGGTAILSRWTIAGSAEAQMQIRQSLVDDGQLALEIELLGPAAGGNRVAVRLASPASERFLGFGMRQEGVAFRGQVLHTWISEGRIGDQPSPNPERYGNARVPAFLSTRGYACLVDGFRQTVFDCASTIPALTITRWHDSMRCDFFLGDDPPAIMEAFTAEAGRIQRVPPPWAFGVWATSVPRGSQTGTERSREVAETLRENGISCSAIWHPYWSHQMSNLLGTGGWRLNEERYPDYQALVDDHHAEGFKILQYFWPYIATGDQIYGSAAAEGRFMRNASGNPYVFDFAFFLFLVAEPDFTDPTVVQWYHDTIFGASTMYGVDGWMTDFGEYHRVDMQAASGESGWSLHNRFAALWAEVNADYWEEQRPDGDYAFLMRAGTTGSQRHAPIMWCGDQEVSWEGADGIKAVVPAVLSAGLSGFPILSTDIAGYHYENAPTDLRQIWLRWCELGALLPVMRLHEGDELHLGERWRFDSDATTLATFKELSRLHARLAPWFLTLAAEARARGLPIIRPLYFHHSSDASTVAIDDQFLVGDRLLVAPVLEEDAVERRLYLPAGRWWHWWSGESFTGPGEITVPAPIGEIPLFVKDGTLLLLFDTPIDTLTEEDDPDLRGWTDINTSMSLRFYGVGSDELTLWDGTRLRVNRPPDAASELTVTNGPERSYRVVAFGGPSRQVLLQIAPVPTDLHVLLDGDATTRRPLTDDGVLFDGLDRFRDHRLDLRDPLMPNASQ